MKSIIFCMVLVLSSSHLFSQEISALPIPLGAGSAEVYNNNIYYIGGSNNWSGSILYDSVFVYDGNSWQLESIIPDRNLWDVETIRIDNEIYLISGWPSGPHLLRKYNLDSKEWTYLANSPNTTTWGVAAEYWNGFIYLFIPNGDIHEYSIQNNEWTTKTNTGITGPLNLSSIIYRDEIFVIGYNDSTFLKYDPSNDNRTILSKSLYQVGASAMGIINDLIYCVGGNISGSSTAEYKSIIVYNATTDEWVVDSLQLSGKRHWMATAEYEGGLYVLGGIDSTSAAVDIIEEIVPQGTVGLDEIISENPRDYQLLQNYPNPFNPATTFEYSLPKSEIVEISIYSVNGQKIKNILSGRMNKGKHKIKFELSAFSSGLYYYKIEAGNFIAVKKMVYIK